MTFVSIILAVIVIGGLLLYLRSENSSKTRSFTPSTGNQASTVLSHELVQQRWSEIQAMQSQGGLGLKNALMEADKLLDYCMKGSGFYGETMGDRLKNHGDRFTNLNAVWAAHKLRNQVAHDVHVDVVKPQVEGAIRDLGQAITDLGVSLA